VRQRGADDARVRRQQDVERRRPHRLEVGRVDRGQEGEPGVVDHDVEPAEARRRRRDDLRDAGAVGDVHRPAVRAAAGGQDLADDCVDPFRRAVGDGDVRALVGEEVGGRAAHAARGAGDDRRTARDRAAELTETGHRRVSFSGAEAWRRYQRSPNGRISTWNDHAVRG
jgi:hypothetical protein